MKSKRTLSGKELKEMFSFATYWLGRSVSEVDALNVFPVPDGDTGTNMLMTMRASLEGCSRLRTTSASEVLDAMARGALAGARGNSGLILSQIIRGMAQGIDGKEIVDAKDLVRALSLAADHARKSMSFPVEGTILTVIRDAAIKASEMVENGEKDIIRVLEATLDAALKSLENTPRLLEVLRNAGVVDAGGKGFCLILEGSLRYLRGEKLGHIDRKKLGEKLSGDSFVIDLDEDEERYGYCTEVMLKGKNLDLDMIKRELYGKGESLIVVGDSKVARVHIHTFDPGGVLSFLQKLGTMHDIRVRNMDEQHREFMSLKKTGQLRDFAILAFAEGDGLEEVLRSLGVSQVLSHLGTKRPDAEEILRVLDSVPSDKVIVLPNRKDLIDLIQKLRNLSTKDVRIIPSETLPQGIASLMAYDYGLSLGKNLESMTRALSSVRSVEILASRGAFDLNGITMQAERLVGIVDGTEIIETTSYDDLVEKIVEMCKDSKWEHVTIYYGKEGNVDGAEMIVNLLKEKKPGAEAEIIRGGQSSSTYLISIE